MYTCMQYFYIGKKTISEPLFCKILKLLFTTYMIICAEKSNEHTHTQKSLSSAREIVQKLRLLCKGPER